MVRVSRNLALITLVLLSPVVGKSDSAPASSGPVASELDNRTISPGAATTTEELPRPDSQRVGQSLSDVAELLRRQNFFERNYGQADSEVLYLSRGPKYSLFLTRTGMTIVLPALQKQTPGGVTSNAQDAKYFRLRFGSANLQPQVTGIENLPGVSNYFSGSDPKLWHAGVPHFARVRYSNLYPGIDLVFYFRDGQLEYDLVAAPDADPSAIFLRAEGANPSVTREGDVAIKSGENELVRLRKPYAYQRGAIVPARYSLHRGNLSFALGKYDRNQPLVIDPTLIFASFVSSNCAECTDRILDMTADNTGVYLTGETSASSFPATATSPAPTAKQTGQTFIVKIDPTGSHVLYTTFLSNGNGRSIAVDGTGSVYVTGITAFPAPSGFMSFPLTAGVFSGTVPPNSSGNVAFATKLSSDGSTIVYSTLLQQPGGTSPPQLVTPTKIAVDSTGALYVTGLAAGAATPLNNTWNPLPTTAGAFQTTPGSAFVMKLNPTASGLDYSTYIDGATPSSTFVTGIAVDSSFDAYVAGSTAETFPTTSGAYQTSNSANMGFSSGYLMKLNPNGTAPVYSTFFGGASGGRNTTVSDLAADSHGQAVITGDSGGSIPTTSNAFCTNYTGPDSPDQGFVAKFTADGSALVYATTLCGPFSNATSVAIDTSDAAYVAGVSGSPATFQPTLLQPIQAYPPTAPSFASVALKLDTAGVLQWSTFLGANPFFESSDGKIAVDGHGNAYVLTQPGITPTPNSFGPPSPSAVVGGSQSSDFLLKIAPGLGAPVPLFNPLQATLVSKSVGIASAPLDVQLGNFGDAPMSPTISITGDFSEMDNCSTAVAGGQKCDINVVFTPTATGTRTGTLTANFGGSISTQTVALTGTGVAPVISLSPTSLFFGVQATGTTSAAQQVTVTNGGTGTLTISSVQASVQFASTNTCGAPLAPGGSCAIQVTFTPTSSGIQTGTLTITDDAPGSPQSVPLTGNQPGAPAVTLAPTSISFPSQAIGTTSAPQPVTITNSGNAPLVISSVQTTTEFASTNTCNDAVAPGSTCTIQVTFSPVASGPATGTLTINDNAAGSPHTVLLTTNQAPGFSLASAGGSSSTSATVAAGQTATYTLNVTETNGFNGSVSFACAGAPANSTCSVSPNPLTVSGKAAAAVTVTVATQASSMTALRQPYWVTPFGGGKYLTGVGLALTLLICLAMAPTHLASRFRQRYVFGTVALAVVAVLFVGCGGGSAPSQNQMPGTASGQYTLKVTATSGSASQAISLSLTVN
jgi:hypothetical protein